MQLLTFAASNSQESINRALVRYVEARLLALTGDDLTIDHIDINHYEMPIYSIDRELTSGIPDAAQRLFDAIGNADAIMVSFAEHNGTVTAAWKNIYDWMSRIDSRVWQDKPIAMLSATPGPRAGQGVLSYQTSLVPHAGGNMIASVGVGRWGQAYDARSQQLTDSASLAAIDALVGSLHAALS
ncbi:MAG: NAD(P)H-dependent oxidoreductase [Pseudomonadota bacterium]